MWWKKKKEALHYAAVRVILELLDFASPRDEKGDKDGGHVGRKER